MDGEENIGIKHYSRDAERDYCQWMNPHSMEVIHHLFVCHGGPKHPIRKSRGYPQEFHLVLDVSLP